MSGAVQVCLNGDRRRRMHPAVPVTAEECALAARDAVDAGATSVHVHPRGEDGAETLRVHAVAATVEAIRDQVPTGVRVGVSTREEIVGSEGVRLSHVRDWPSPERGGPDFASVNWHELGSETLADTLRANGIGIEAGIWSPRAASRFVATGWPTLVERVLVEVLPGHSPGATGVLAAERILSALGRQARPVLVHGEEHWAWDVVRWAQRSGHDVRIGLEDVLVMPDGRSARDNAELVRAALHGPSGRP